MLIVSYDISEDKLRTHFSKFLSKFGFRLQYSVFQIRNSERVLRNILSEIDHSFKNRFTQSDSIVIFDITDASRKICYGYAKCNDEDFILVS